MTISTDPIEIRTDEIIDTVRRAVIEACDLRLDDAYRRGYRDALDGVAPPGRLHRASQRGSAMSAAHRRASHRVETTRTIEFDHNDDRALFGTIDGTTALFSPYGDSIKGGYNGGWSMIIDGRHVAYLDYQTHPDVDDVLVAMVEVDPAERRKGFATALLRRLQLEYPDTSITYGMMTSDGAQFFATVTPSVVAGDNEAAR